MVTCICGKCENYFDESEITTKTYREYPGAKLQKDYVSPCCESWYDYLLE